MLDFCGNSTLQVHETKLEGPLPVELKVKVGGLAVSVVTWVARIETSLSRALGFTFKSGD